MSTSLYILDLDRCAFNSDRFTNDLIAILERTYSIDPQHFRSQLQQSSIGEIGPDFFACTEAATGQPANIINQLLAGTLEGTDYTYADTGLWVNQRSELGEPVMVVTVGRNDFQELKFRCAKSLQNLPKTIVRDNKGKVLREILAGERPDNLGLTIGQQYDIKVIDDNPRTFEELGPQDHITQFYLSRPGEKYAGLTVPAYVTTISSLKELS